MGEQAEFDRLAAGIAHGRGIVARFPGLLCVADGSDPEPVRALMALCSAVAGFEPGRPLARRLAAWLAGPEAPPSSLRFGTLADAGDRWAVFLSGSVSLHEVSTDTTIRGSDAAAWTDRLIPPGGPMVLTVDGGESDKDGSDEDGFADLYDLRAGMVPGCGVVLGAQAPPLTVAPPIENPAPADVETPVPAAEPATAPALLGLPEEKPTEITVADGSGTPPISAPAQEETDIAPPHRAERIDNAPAPAPRAPLEEGRPLAPLRQNKPSSPRRGAPDLVQPEQAVEANDDNTVVDGPRTRGHLCSRGHLNDPRSHFCVLCGIRMDERTGELVFGARPPLGLLVFDDGATYTVDAEYLVGRMPDVDARVRNGSLRSIVVEDRSGAISRVHAEVRVQGWDVMLVDSRSRNGTHIAEPGATGWTPVPVGRSHRLTPGTRVRLGGRTFLFESPSGVR